MGEFVSRTLFGDDIGNDGLLVTNLIINSWGPIDWWSIQDRIKVILIISIISQQLIWKVYMMTFDKADKGYSEFNYR